MGFIGNLFGFPAVKEFWKSVKNLQSYRHEFGVLLFWGHGVTMLLRVPALNDCMVLHCLPLVQRWLWDWLVGVLNPWGAAVLLLVIMLSLLL